jgi:hypothetical protein
MIQQGTRSAGWPRKARKSRSRGVIAPLAEPLDGVAGKETIMLMPRSRAEARG